MPALNEEANIASALSRSLGAFDDAGLRGEVVVINDGSTDRTVALVETAAAADGRNRVVLLNHDVPRGIGASFRDGVRAARGEVVAMMPGDDENDPSEILRYLPLMEQVDLVVPFVFNREVRPRSRNLLSTLYRTIVNLSFGLNFTYTNGTVLYRRPILSGSENTSDGFFFQTENIVRLARRGYLYAEVPYRLDIRREGESKAVSFRSLTQVMKDYLRLIREVRFPPPAAAGVTLAVGSVSARRRAG